MIKKREKHSYNLLLIAVAMLFVACLDLRSESITFCKDPRIHFFWFHSSTPQEGCNCLVEGFLAEGFSKREIYWFMSRSQWGKVWGSNAAIENALGEPAPHLDKCGVTLFLPE